MGEKIYYDRASVLRQLGVFREPTTVAGRLLTAINLRKDYNPRPDFKQTAEPSSLNPLEYKLTASRKIKKS